MFLLGVIYLQAYFAFCFQPSAKTKQKKDCFSTKMTESFSEYTYLRQKKRDRWKQEGLFKVLFTIKRLLITKQWKKNKIFN